MHCFISIHVMIDGAYIERNNFKAARNLRRGNVQAVSRKYSCYRHLNQA